MYEQHMRDALPSGWFRDAAKNLMERGFTIRPDDLIIGSIWVEGPGMGGERELTMGQVQSLWESVRDESDSSKFSL